MAATESHGYINVRSSQTGELVVRIEDAPPGTKIKRYMNMSFHESADAKKSETDSPRSEKERSGSEKQVDQLSPTLTLTSSTRGVSAFEEREEGSEDHPTLRRHNSEVTWEDKARLSPRLSPRSKNPPRPKSPGGASPEGGVAEAKIKLLIPSSAGSGCENCNELNKLLAMWEIGVSGLTRNYSRILAHLMKIRDSAMALECRLSESGSDSSPKVSTDGINSRSSAAGGNGSPSLDSPLRVPKNRQSMFVKNGNAIVNSVREQDLAENMYPTRQEATANVSVDSKTALPPDLKDLNSHLGEAIDLCQQLAAACFKTNHLSGFSGARSSSHSSPLKKHETSSDILLRKHNVATPPNDTSPHFKPSLQSIAESKVASGDLKRKRQRTLERIPSAPNLEYSGDFCSSGDSTTLEPGFVTVDAKDVLDTVRKASATKKKQGENGKKSSRKNSRGNSKTASDKVEEVSPTKKNPHDSASFSIPSTRDFSLSVERDSGLGYRPESFLSTVSTYSDSDVKCVMSKIAMLEDERYKLLQTIDTLQDDNNNVRLSLHELLGDLENKDLQLTLAMQDLSIATGEIKRAAEMRGKLDGLSKERDLLLEKLSDLEDESAAVKVSLIQLLQEKSATNKTLALENYRLSQRVRQSFRQGRKSSSGSGEPPAVAGGDNVSIRSGYSATVEDAALQEIYMGAAMSEHFVHKQGFLTKQGGKVKNWKKRLFVLNTEGLSYYKTESPIQTVPIHKIDKVQICHRSCSQPHMFEVHTQGRTFYLSAPTADEMQSWVGMLETLKQYNRAFTLQREANKQVPPEGVPQGSPHGSAASPGSGSSDVVILSSPERTSHSPMERESLSPTPPAGEERSEDEEVQTHQRIHQSPQLDGDEDDASYLQGLRLGAAGGMSVPTGGFYQEGGEQSSDLLSGLDLSTS